MKNRVILATSPLQVVIAKASIDNMRYEDEIFYKTFVIAIHPHLNEVSIRTLKYYSDKFNFEFLNLTKIFPIEEQKENFKIFKKLSVNKIKDKFKNLRKNYLYNNNERSQNILKISNIIKTHFLSVDEIFLRSNYKLLDLAFINAMNKPIKFFQIEDGYHDQVIYSNNINKIFKKIYQTYLYTIYCYILFFLTFISTFKLKSSFQNNVRYKIKFDKRFSILKNNNKYINIRKNFNKILNYYSDLKIDSDNIILILGSIFRYDWELNFYDEIDIYNKLISKIIKNENIDVSNIYYKPHPRCKNISDKEKFLNCQILNNNINLIVEEYFAKMKISKLYSLGSTALIYGKTVFNIDSFFLDITKYKSNFKGYEYNDFWTQEHDTYNKFGLKKIDIK